MSRYDKDIDGNPFLSEHGKYAAQFARNHGISMEEAYKHPTVKAHKEALNHLAECYAFSNGGIKEGITMKIEIEIPKEFEDHFKKDRFEDTLHRLSADAHMTAGNYEKETAIMLIQALKNSKPAYDVGAVADRLEELRHTDVCEQMDCYSCPYTKTCDIITDQSTNLLLDKVVEIVKGGGVDG